ncbi:MAG: COX15/CtaA family protein [Bacteroidia bacterium]|nr:COX15/CtaA family protein [Bacteroidia bacterium]
MRNLILACIINTYLIILAGSVVRVTGSGMGCPDWPKCFGQLAPPTDPAQLPANYKEIYFEKRIQKNEKLAKILNSIGATNLAFLIQTDPSIKVETDFSVSKAWTEYVNRLCGVMLGPLLIALCIWSYRKRSEFQGVFGWSLLVFAITLFQAWFGSIVVSTNILPGILTVHMVLSFVIFGILLKMYDLVSPNPQLTSSFVKWICFLALVLSFTQVMLGTEVRKQIDQISYLSNYLQRNTWIDQLDWKFYVHRSFSILVLATNTYLFFKLSHARTLLTISLMVVLVAEILSGMVLAYLNVPIYIQPVHLVFACLMFGLQTLLYFRLKPQL